MTCKVRNEVIAILAGCLLVSVAFVGGGPFVATPPAVPSPAGSVHAAAPGLLILNVTPWNGQIVGSASPTVVVIYTAVPPASAVVGVDFHLDGMNLTSAGMFNQTAFVLPLALELRSGPHLANFTVVDNLREAAFVNWTFTVDTVPPILLVTAPAYPMVPVSLVLVQGTALLASPLFASAAPVNVTATVLPSHVEGWTLAAANGSFSIPVPLAEGVNTIFVNATDRVDNLASVIKNIVSDTMRPPLVVLTPANGSVSPTSHVLVSGLTEPGAYVTVDGFSVAVFPNGTWSVSLDLPDGLNIVQVAAADAVGNLNYTGLGVFVDSDVPQISLTSPTTALTDRSEVLVAGSVHDAMVVALLVNGLPVTFNATGGFSTVLTLPDGVDPIVIVAVDAARHTSIFRTAITVDTTPPVVTILSPPDGLETNQSTVWVNGTVNDPNATVLVGSQVLRPDASGRWQTTVALVVGANAIVISATDAAGNHAADVTRHITYFSPWPNLEDRISANQQNLDNLSALVRFSLVAIALLAVGLELELYTRTVRKVRQTQELVVALARAQKRKP